MYRYVLGVKTYKLFVLLFVISLFTEILIGNIENLFFDINFSSSDEIGSISKRSFPYFIFSVIVAPMLETAVFQKMTIGFCRVFIKNNLICVIISAVIFGVMHLNGIAKIIVITSGGIYLGLFYTVCKRRGLNAFWLTTLFHASWNLFVFTINFFDL